MINTIKEIFNQLVADKTNDWQKLNIGQTVKDSKGTTYHLFSDDKGSSGVFGDEGIKTNFKTPEESMRAKFDMWRTSLEEEDFELVKTDKVVHLVHTLDCKYSIKIY